MYINFAPADLLYVPLSDYFASSLETRGKILTGVAFFTWWLFTKNVKLIRLYKRDIWDIRFSLVSILFGWYHIVIKLKAACNLHKVLLVFSLTHSWSNIYVRQVGTIYNSLLTKRYREKRIEILRHLSRLLCKGMKKCFTGHQICKRFLICFCI
jgi:hypothetical protein